MALELMPDGKTFKKLNAVQEKALKRYYKRAQDKPLIRDLALPIGLAVLGGIGAIAYVFKDELQQYLKDKEEDVVTWIGGLPRAGGGLVADAIINLEGALFPQNPINPEFVILNEGTPQERTVGPFSRCQRWANDAADWKTVKQSKGDLGPAESVVAALAAARIIKNMKKEGCPKPSAFTQAQWDDI